jgi:GxxExxY protein
MQFEEVTEKIIGCAYRVYNRMGFGFLESVYEKCLLVKLRKAGLRARPQEAIAVHYDGEIVGEFVADVMVEDTIIVELKSVRGLALAHEVQLVNYLVATGKPVGLLLNFGEQKVEVRRNVRDLEQIRRPLHDPANPIIQSNDAFQQFGIDEDHQEQQESG